MDLINSMGEGERDAKNKVWGCRYWEVRKQGCGKESKQWRNKARLFQRVLEPVPEMWRAGQVTLIGSAAAWGCPQLGNLILPRLTGKLAVICQEFLEVVGRCVSAICAFSRRRRRSHLS